MGSNAKASGSFSLSTGYNTQASGEGTIALGDKATGSEKFALAIGRLTKASGEASTAIGNNSQALSIGSVAIGLSALANGGGNAHAVAIGNGAQAGTSTQGYGETVAIGGGSSAQNYYATALGSSAYASGSGSTAIGYTSKASDSNVVSFGHSKTDTDGSGTAYGSDLNRRLIHVADGTTATDAATVSQTATVSSANGSVKITKSTNTNGSTNYGLSIDKVTVNTDGKIESGNTGILSGGTAYTALYAEQTAREQADTDLSNKIGTLGANGNYIQKDASVSSNLSTLDAQVKTNADAIDKEKSDREATITNVTNNLNSLTDSAVQYDKDSSKTKVTLAGEGGTMLTNVKAGALSDSSMDAVNGSQLYAEQTARTQADTALSNQIGSLNADGNYIQKSASVSSNLSTLDTQVKTNADAIDKEKSDREAAITNITNNIGDLSNSAVKYDADSNKGKVTLAGEGGTTLTNVKDGAISDSSTDAVTGKQLFAEQTAHTQADTDLSNRIGSLDNNGNYIQKDASVSSNLSTLDTQVKTNADAISKEKSDRESAITNITNNIGDLSNSAVKYDADSNKGKATLAGEGGTTLTNVKAGALSDASTDAVNGSQLYAEQQARIQADMDLSNRIGSLDNNGNYIQKDASVSSNLSILDTQVKTNADAISKEKTDRENAVTNITNNIGDLSNSAVKYDADSNKGKVTLAGESGTTLTNVKDGALSDSSTDAVTGKQLFAEQTARTQADTDLSNKIGSLDANGNYIQKDASVSSNLSTLDTQVKTNAEAIDKEKSDREAAITNITNNVGDLSNSAVQYDADSNKGKVTLAGESGTSITNLKDGALSDASTDAVTGKQLYAEQTAREQADTALSNQIGSLDADGNYIQKVASVSSNLSTLDTQVKTNTDAISSLSDSTNTALSIKANVDASNIGANLKDSDGTTAATAAEITANEDAWGTAIGTGTISSASGQLVTGKTVYDELRPTSDGIYVKMVNTTAANLSALDTQVSTNTTDISALKNLSNITDTGKTVIKDLAKNTVKVAQGDRVTVTSTTDDSTGAITYTVFANNDGAVAFGNTDLISGATAYMELRPTADGNYIKTGNTTAVNLSVLDTQVKTNADAIDKEKSDREAAITNITNNIGDLSNSAVKYDADSNKGKVTLAGEGGTTITNLKAGALSDASTDAVTGKQLYAEQTARTQADTDLSNKIGTLDANGNYIQKDASVSSNLSALDTQVKTNANAIDKEKSDRESAITNIINNIGDLSNSAVKYDTDSNKGKITLEGASGTTITNVKDGALSDASTDAVTGKQLYAEQTARTQADTDLSNKIGTLDANGNYIQKDTSVSSNLSTLDTQVKTNADAISKEKTDRESAITNITNNIGDLSNSAVKYDADSSKGKVTLAGASGTTLTNVKDGALSDSSTDAVTGKQLYAEQTAREQADMALSNQIGSLNANGNYIQKNSCVSSNLSVLDTQVKNNADAISQETSNREAAITNITNNLNSLSNSAVRYDNSSNKTKVTLAGVGGTTLTNVKAGVLSASSTDAVNGAQLYAEQQSRVQDIADINNNIGTLADGVQHAVNQLTHDINKVGAGAAALAGLHPGEYDPADKWDFAAGYGHYKGANASAFGAYYHPNEDTLISLSGTIGNGDPMLSAGVTFKLGSGAAPHTMSRTALTKELSAVQQQNQTLAAQNQAIAQKMAAVDQKNQQLEKDMADLKAKLAALMAAKA